MNITFSRYANVHAMNFDLSILCQTSYLSLYIYYDRVCFPSIIIVQTFRVFRKDVFADETSGG